MKRVVIFLLAVAVFGLVAIWLLEWRQGVSAESDVAAPEFRGLIPVRDSVHSVRRTAAPATRDVRKAPAKTLPLLDGEDEWGESANLSPAEKDIAARIDKALGDEDLETTIACADYWGEWSICRHLEGQGSLRICNWREVDRHKNAERWLVGAL